MVIQMVQTLQTVCIHCADRNLLKIFKQKLQLLVNSQ